MQHDLVLAGHGWRLEPLAHEHAGALAVLVDEEVWAGMLGEVPDTVDAMARWISAALDEPARQAFAVVDDSDGAAVGSTSLYELSLAQRRVEVGHTFYGRSRWGGRTNPACKRLLLGHCFDTLGLARVALRCDADNARSAAAIGRLGAVREGVLRSHRQRRDGTRGDTVYFSVLAGEWPAVRAALDARLDQEQR